MVKGQVTSETFPGRPKVKSKFLAKLMETKRQNLLEKSQKWGFDFEKEAPLAPEAQETNQVTAI